MAVPLATAVELATPNVVGLTTATRISSDLPPTTVFIPPTELLLPATDVLSATNVLPASSPLAPPTHAIIGQFTQAGFTLRLAAFMIDSLLILTVLLITSLIANALYSVWTTFLFVGYFLTFCFGFYNHIVLLLPTGQTLGKRIVGIQIISRNQHPATPRQLLQRTLLGYPLAILPAGLGLAWLLWDRQQQGWHDHLANTIVIKRYSD
jgi:uncharacterized RDD family membrane protein YckC